MQNPKYRELKSANESSVLHRVVVPCQSAMLLLDLAGFKKVSLQEGGAEALVELKLVHYNSAILTIISQVSE